QDVCALCQQLVGFLRHISNQSAVEVVLDQVLGVLCPPLPFAAPPCRALLRALLHRLLCEIQHLEPRQVCATLKLCRGELGAVPVPEVPGDRPQGSAGPGLSPRALPVPVPLCWMCRTLVARAE
ncbi:PSPB protein, partial [Vireo altiloquus]|nr:PSPB protein [Vireo altiloquus]